MYSPHILLVEDELSVGKGLQMILREEGYSVNLASNGKSALDEFTGKPFDLVVADLRLPDIDGMDVVKHVKQSRPEIAVIVITGYASVSSAVTAMKMGVFDYLPKPFTEEEFKEAVQAALKDRQQAPSQELLHKEQASLIQRREVIRVLERAAEEELFARELMERGSQALEKCQLSTEAKAAIVSGDLNWLKQHIGKLTDKQLAWVRSRLEQERW